MRGWLIETIQKFETSCMKIVLETFNKQNYLKEVTDFLIKYINIQKNISQLNKYTILNEFQTNQLFYYIQIINDIYYKYFKIQSLKNMDWLSITPQREIQQQSYSQKLSQMQKITLYDHNYTSEIDQQEMTFVNIFNCKKITRNYSTICKIEGNLKYGHIKIYCSLLNQLLVSGGKWNYQKIQLLRFALKYNERSQNNISIKVNPINGQVNVCICFMISPNILKDIQKLRQIVTDNCQKIGQQSERIFHSIIQIIYGQQANQPYLKTLRVNSAFPPHVKIDKLLDKIKSLIATSNHYKIRKDISTAHKNRSFFKKIYLGHQAKSINKPFIYQLARIFQMKFHKRYQQGNGDMSKLKPQYIKKYQQIQQKYETQFAKYLKNDKDQKQQSFQQQRLIQQIIITQEIDLKTFVNGQRIIRTKNGPVKFYIQKMPNNSEGNPYDVYKEQLAKFIQKEKSTKFYDYIVRYYRDINYPTLRITEPNLMSLQTFLIKNKDLIRLQTKLNIMGQICHILQHLHTKQWGFFIHINNIVINQNGFVKIRGLQQLYSIKQSIDLKNLQTKQIKDFPYTFSERIILDRPMKDKENLQKIIDLRDAYNLGIILYKILMEKFPFYHNQPQMNIKSAEEWEALWVVQTQYFLRQGGQIIKLLAALLLKCLNLKQIENRAYIEWVTVVIYETKQSLQSLF